MTRRGIAFVLCLAAGVLVATALVAHSENRDEPPSILEQLADARTVRVQIPTDPLALELMEADRARLAAAGDFAELRKTYGKPVRAPQKGEAPCWTWPPHRVYFCRDEQTGEGWSYRLPPER
jgi:hypothetical protein